jgi:hypothetical protein
MTSHVSGIIGNMVEVHSDLSKAKERLRILSAIWTRALKIFASTVIGRKRLEQYGFKRCQNFYFARSVHMPRAGHDFNESLWLNNRQKNGPKMKIIHRR